MLFLSAALAFAGAYSYLARRRCQLRLLKAVLPAEFSVEARRTVFAFEDGKHALD